MAINLMSRPGTLTQSVFYGLTDLANGRFFVGSADDLQTDREAVGVEPAGDREGWLPSRVERHRQPRESGVDRLLAVGKGDGLRICRGRRCRNRGGDERRQGILLVKVGNRTPDDRAG